MIHLHHGDCIDVMRGLPDASVDSVVTDPPYHLTSIVKRFGGENAAPAKSNGATGVYARSSAGFMNQTWDGGDIAFRVELWAEVCRVLKPGGHLVAFSGTRTYHRMACAIEDAGFEVRDQLSWIYGSGFPKSHNVGKQFDKARRRDYVQAALELGVSLPGRSVTDWTEEDHAPGEKWWREFKAALPAETWAAIERKVIGTAVTGRSGWFVAGEGDVTAPATELAKQWDGWGTALKPAHEPICLARRPLIGTVAVNVAAHGTGAINISGCLVETSENLNGGAYAEQGNRSVSSSLHAGGGMNQPGKTTGRDYEQPAGRWPANVCHDGSDEVLEAFARFGEKTSGNLRAEVQRGKFGQNGVYGTADGSGTGRDYVADTGTAARFFFCGKATREERDIGCESLIEKPRFQGGQAGGTSIPTWSGKMPVSRNTHPTVKPLALMQWLCRLVTPPGGTILDPFLGSGSTAIAADREGFNCIGIESSAEYLEIARRRIHGDAPLFTELSACA